MIMAMANQMLPKNDAPSLSFEHERLLALINSMLDGVIAVGEDSRIILSNSIALETLDINSLNGRKVNDVLKLISPDDQPVDVWSVISTAALPYSNNSWRVSYDDGSTANLSVNISPVRAGVGNPGAGGWVIIIRDITAEKSLEEERDDFISVTSHELRTPIAIAEGNISNALLLADHSAVGPEIHQTLAAAHDQILFLGNLINDLAMLSRANRGKLALTIEEFNVYELLDTLADDYQPQAQAKGLSISVEISADIGLLNSSQLYIREILQNFVTNSLKYTEKGGIVMSAERLDDGIKFMVKDTGIGISKSDQNKLFKKFFRSDDWRVKKVSGTGLGLYVTAKLIKLLNGRLDMESELNKGTTVSLFIPSFTGDQSN
jgi:PAS domain S-box-containing protein